MSIIKLLPWRLLDASQQQQCFELIQMTADALSTHLDRGNSPVTSELFDRMLDITEKYVNCTAVQASYIKELRSPVACNTTASTKSFDIGDAFLEEMTNNRISHTREELLEKIHELEEMIKSYKQQLSLSGGL